MKRAFAILFVAALVTLFVAWPNRGVAHIGAVATVANVVSPPVPAGSHVDGGTRYDPFTFATADTTYTVKWTDGDTDPTGRYFFYYLDHQPTYDFTASDLQTLATAIPGLDGFWASCTCAADAGVICPDAGVRNCANQFDWDTSQLPAGTYWIVALNNDPPYFVYSTSSSPIRVAHGGAALPPAAVVLMPDGFGAFDQSYRVVWTATGTGTLHFDLEYGLDSVDGILQPTTVIAKDVTPIVNADGTYGYDWDISALPDKDPQGLPLVYYVRVRVSDDTGQKSYTDSRLGLSVAHAASGDGGVIFSHPDLGVVIPGFETPKHDSGCATPPSTVSAGTLAAPIMLALALVIFLALTRRRG